MKALSKHGKVWTGRLAEIMVSKGLAKAVEEPGKAEAPQQPEEVKKAKGKSKNKK